MAMTVDYDTQSQKKSHERAGVILSYTLMVGAAHN
jgi:hypothetical protein